MNLVMIAGGLAATGAYMVGKSGTKYVPDSTGQITVTDVADDLDALLDAGYTFPPQTSSLDGIVAHAGGGQSSATLLSAGINRITTVATTGDSAKLPPATPGVQVTVINADANSMNLFPASGEQINSLGINNAFALAAGKTVICTSAGKGQWHTLLSS